MKEVNTNNLKDMRNEAMDLLQEQKKKNETNWTSVYESISGVKNEVKKILENYKEICDHKLDEHGLKIENEIDLVTKNYKLGI